MTNLSPHLKVRWLHKRCARIPHPCGSQDGSQLCGPAEGARFDTWE